MQGIEYIDLNGHYKRGENFQNTGDGKYICRDGQRLFVVEQGKQINRGLSVAQIIEIVSNS